MTQDPERGNRAEIARARKKLYEILSFSFFYPRSKEFVQLRACLEIPKLKKAVYALPAYYGLGDDFKPIRIEAYQTSELEQEFNRLFIAYPPACPVLERDYGPSNLPSVTRTINEIQSYYKEVGLRLPQFLQTFPDHIIAELEFMRTLTDKEMDAERKGSSAEANGYRGMEGKFLREHLGMWFPSFCSALSKARLGLYVDVASLGTRFLAGEIRFLEESG